MANVNKKNLTDQARRIQNILENNHMEIVSGPNCGGVTCLWLVNEGEPYYHGVYISKL